MITLAASLMTLLFVHAQSSLQGTRGTDNWSFGASVGTSAPLIHSVFFTDIRPAFGLSINKQLTPIYGLTSEFMMAVNTERSTTDYDNISVFLTNRLNLNNLLAGYHGRPRFFEVETALGVGYLRFIDYSLNKNENSIGARLGLNLNFNMDKARYVTLSLRPHLIYDLRNKITGKIQFDTRRALWEISACVILHLKNSNGYPYMTRPHNYYYREVEFLNEAVNELRYENEQKSVELEEARSVIEEQQRVIEELRNQQLPAVEQPVQEAKPEQPMVASGNKALESVVLFRQGSAVVDSGQLPAIERIAAYLKKHPGAMVVIQGYASPEGSDQLNIRLAGRRAEAVKSLLVNRYRISAYRIRANGAGLVKVYEEPDWNRVSISTIIK